MRGVIMKKVLIVFSIVTLLLCFCSCLDNNGSNYRYSGEYPDLYTEAIHSILGSTGNYRNAETGHCFDPLLEVVEQDACGRKMFLYHDGSGLTNSVSLLVSQKSEDGIVYYYPDFNLTLGEFDYAKSQKKDTEEAGYIYYYPTGNYYRIKFPEEKVAELKQINDWGKEINIEKCITQTVVLKKEDPLSSEEKNALYEEVFGIKKAWSYPLYVTKDDEGKMLFVAVYYDDHDDYRMIIVDGNTQHNRKITNVTAYQEELAEFKRENNWKKT